MTDKQLNTLNELDASNAENEIVELWKEAKGTDLVVSSLGRVLRASGKVSYGNLQSEGYYRSFFKRPDGSLGCTTVQRLVAYAFGLLDTLPSDYYTDVDHKNNVRSDNRLENLQVLSHRENIKKRDQGISNKKKVSQYTIYGWYKVNDYKSIREASKNSGVAESAICNCCQGKQKSAGGYFWLYS